MKTVIIVILEMLFFACFSVSCSSAMQRLPKHPLSQEDPPINTNRKMEASAPEPISETTRLRPEVVILGALHEAHKRQFHYSLDKLDKIFNQLNPDVVLIEIPMDRIHGREYSSELLSYLESEENQSETTVAWEYCKLNNIECLPYDIIDQNGFYRDPQRKQCDSIFLKAVDDIDSCDPEDWGGLQRTKINLSHCIETTPKVLNSSICDGIKKRWDALLVPFIEKYIQKRHPDFDYCLPQYIEFEERRNRVMAENICNHARSNSTARILATVGFEHRPYLKQYLKESCPEINLREYWELIPRN